MHRQTVEAAAQASHHPQKLDSSAAVRQWRKQCQGAPASCRREKASRVSSLVVTPTTLPVNEAQPPLGSGLGHCKETTAACQAGQCSSQAGQWSGQAGQLSVEQGCALLAGSGGPAHRPARIPGRVDALPQEWQHRRAAQPCSAAALLTTRLATVPIRLMRAAEGSDSDSPELHSMPIVETYWAPWMSTKPTCSRLTAPQVHSRAAAPGAAKGQRGKRWWRGGGCGGVRGLRMGQGWVRGQHRAGRHGLVRTLSTGK